MTARKIPGATLLDGEHDVRVFFGYRGEIVVIIDDEGTEVCIPISMARLLAEALMDIDDALSEEAVE